jgi:hypothetical protein
MLFKEVAVYIEKHTKQMDTFRARKIQTCLLIRVIVEVRYFKIIKSYFVRFC